MLVDALQNGYDLNTEVMEIDLYRSKAVYDASGNPMSFKGAVRLTIQVSKGTRHRIGLFVLAVGDDVIVLGTNALKKLGWNLPPYEQSMPGRAEVSRGRRYQHKEGKAKEAAVRQQILRASNTVIVAQRLCLKPGETKGVSPRCDDMKQDGVLRSSGEILLDTEGQDAQHQTQVPVRNSFAGAKMFREGEVVSTCVGTQIAEGVVFKARSEVYQSHLQQADKAVFLQQPEAKRALKKARLDISEASEESKKRLLQLLVFLDLG
ncbi:unnamed protein product [Heligmosomoides polygyrus]|uniref:RMI1_N domain-containing protein n=1 Tax=Heligmosomoides polygyrus TaxID=6339 RepID=A0A183FUY8_HELPZ|nr:unnamed protein product [Heligmosomoides polygyrus]